MNKAEYGSASKIILLLENTGNLVLIDWNYHLDFWSYKDTADEFIVLLCWVFVDEVT